MKRLIVVPMLHTLAETHCEARAHIRAGIEQLNDEHPVDLSVLHERVLHEVWGQVATRLRTRGAFASSTAPHTAVFVEGIDARMPQHEVGRLIARHSTNGMTYPTYELLAHCRMRGVHIVPVEDRSTYQRMLVRYRCGMLGHTRDALALLMRDHAIARAIRRHVRRYRLGILLIGGGHRVEDALRALHVPTRIERMPFRALYDKEWKRLCGDRVRVADL